MNDVSDNDSNPARSRRVLPWVLILILVAAAIAGSYVWKSNRGESASPAAQGETKRAVAALQQTAKDLQSGNQHATGQISGFQRQLSAEQGELQLLSGQLGALATRVKIS